MGCSKIVRDELGIDCNHSIYRPGKRSLTNSGVVFTAVPFISIGHILGLKFKAN